jgi:hypothetical protein
VRCSSTVTIASLQRQRPLERLLDVEVVVELELPLLRVTRRDGLVEPQDLRERRETLLAVASQSAGVS